MATSTWTHNGQAWTDPGAFTPTAPGMTDVALFSHSLLPETVAGDASLLAAIVQLDDISFTGTVDLAPRGLLVDELGIARFVGGGMLNTNGLVAVGEHGSGSLTLNGNGNGPGPTSGVVTIGQLAGASGVVDLSGESWTVSHFIVVGGAGLGDLAVKSGLFIGRMGEGDLVVGRLASGSGVVTVAGSGAYLSVAGTIRVGEAGNGQLLVSSSASVTAGEFVVSGSGAVSIADAQIAVGGTAFLAAGATLIGGGSFRAATIGNEGTITARGDLAVFGTVSGSGTLAIAQGGTLSITQDVLRLQHIAFEGPRAELILQSATSTLPTIAAAITGFGLRDLLLVQDAVGVSYAAATGALTVDLRNGAFEQLHVAGLSSSAVFQLEGRQGNLGQIVLTHQ